MKMMKDKLGNMKEKKQRMTDVWLVIVLSFIICHLSLCPAKAQVAMADAFRQMPDSLLPSLTRNNRLDLVDFCEAKMMSVVKNRLDEEVEMTALASDSLSLRMSPALRVDMKLCSTTEAYDSCHQVIAVMHTYFLTDNRGQETALQFYTLRWRPLPFLPGLLRLPPSTILKEDDDLFSRKHF